MSHLEAAVQPSSSADCDPPAAAPIAQRVPARSAEVGEGLRIQRALPARQRRLVGAWCFLDHIGPADLAGTRGLRVGPHPHIGLQTVTWLIEGEILHRDSLGSLQPIRPGQLNLMTSGRGISHSEESPSPGPSQIHGLQLWIALPNAARTMAPAFDHYPSLPTITRGGASVTVLAGEAMGERSPAAVHSPLVGLDLRMEPGSSMRLPLRPEFEYGALVTQGALTAGGEPLAPGTLLYLGRGRDELSMISSAGARAVLLGGEPLGETVLMWWNFVARTRLEILQACQDWNEHAAYLGEVDGYDGARLVAPLPPWAAGAPDAAG
ncbi:MAG TPA: pirin family protein [Burkholderiaceae bacterium]|nr:pirin family protein [Burkholderiaceae bacterium]